MTHTIVTARGVSVHEYDYDDPTVRLSWDLPDTLVVELPLLPDDVALRVSLADLRAWAKERETKAVTA